MNKHIHILLSGMLLLGSHAFAQKSAPLKMYDYEPSWKKVDSLQQIGRPESAQKIVLDILKKAQSIQDEPQIIKAQTWMMVLNKEENADVLAIKSGEKQLAAAKDPVQKALWANATAKAYQSYLNANRYVIYGRTQSSQQQSQDLATWDVNALQDTITRLYKMSLQDRDALRNILTRDYSAIISKGEHTDHLRPYLYDVLVFDAIDYFSSDERTITKPAYAFQLNEASYFAPAAAFANRKLEHKDQTSLHFQALKLYQEVIGRQIALKNNDALIDADLLRLGFVHTYSTLPDKDALYSKALEQIINQASKQDDVAQAMFLLQQQKYNQYPQHNRSEHTGSKATVQIDMKDLAASLSAIIAAFPKSEGAVNAQHLLDDLNQKQLSINMQLVQIPGQPILASVTYRNVARTEAMLYKLTPEEFIMRNGLRKTNLLRKWEQLLINSSDLKEHRTEIKIDALPLGQYMLVMRNPDYGMDTLYHYFQVSKLSMVKGPKDYGTGTTADIYILDRELGTPVDNATLQYKKDKWMTLAKSGKDGLLDHTISNRTVDYNTLLELVQGKDRLILHNEAGNLMEYDRNNTENKEDRYQDFLFTDRSIYRPGQTVYFKGISVKSSYDSRQSTVVTNKEVAVTFKDANGQLIKELKLTSNAFGSFSGSFTAPESGLTGTMYIQTGKGSAYFNVEEYKRPRFQVSFDTVKNNYALNDEVTIKGKAIAYAGNSISDAQVQYRVVRRTRFPYYWKASRWGFPMSSAQQEMTNGTTETDASGSFSIHFKAIPDASIPADAAPVFQYEITADITDINGETRSSTSYFSAGYAGIILSADIADQLTPEQLSKLSIRTENLNGVFTPAPVTVKVSLLKSPDHFYRERLWEAPTDFVLKESEFHAAFPNDMYGEEWKPENRAVAAIVWEHQYTTAEATPLQTKEDIWKQTGYYLIEISTKDHNGKAVTEKKYVFVWNEKQPEQKEFPLFVKNDAATYEPGQQWKQWIIPAYNKANLLQYNSWNKVFTPAADKTIRQQITEADRGGAFTSWAYVYQNRFYSGSEQINVPWSNKELQLSWATHRDKLQPGATEEWTLTISGDKKDKIAAEMMAAMYDASLDALNPHRWSWDKLQPQKYFSGYWSAIAFGERQSGVYSSNGTITDYNKAYPALFPYLQFSQAYEEVKVYGARREARAAGTKDGNRRMNKITQESSDDPNSLDPSGVAFASSPAAADEKAGGQQEKKAEPAFSPRTNLKETAFFMPHLQTDDKGNVVVKFTMPEALTEWKFMAFAHTKDWKTGYLEGKIKTQKDLMVTPNVPRFFRQGDEMVLTAKISNLSNTSLKGTATISFVNALTGQPLDKAFGQANSSKSFTVAAGDNIPVSFTLNVPQSVYEPVAVSIVAQAGNFSDGESHTIPVVTNRMLVTETLPMPVKGDGTTTFTLDKLLQSAQSNSLVHKGLTIEYTANPAWYAVQALPYLMEYPYECAEQTFNRFYANALATHIAAQTPKIRAIFDKWNTEDTTAMLSNLSKNQELKSALLEETPWVLEAQSEQEQKRNIAKLFATHKMAAELNKSLDKLAKMQNNDGSFSWFEGMQPDRYITQYILTGMAKLQQLNVATASNNRIDQMVTKGLQYLDGAIVKEYKEIKKEKLKEGYIGQTQVQYLFLRSMYPASKMTAATQTAFDYYRTQSKQYWTKQNNYMQGMIALTLFRTKEVTTAKSILASLSERAIRNQETGMYWKRNPGYWWYEAPVETQALLIQAYKEIQNDQASVDQMNIWLLKQKQTQHWRTTTATADACYALLYGNAAWLQNEPTVSIRAGAQTISSDQSSQEAGTGYFKQTIPGSAVSADMGKLSVTVQNSPGAQNAIGWGAAYWQYFENMNKISSSVNENMPLQIEKQLFVSRNSDRGPVLTPITAGSLIRVGDKVTVRVIIRADRSMDYVHLKDMRAAGFEPVNVLSGYRYSNGLGYYESTRDLASHFFIDRLNKGTYVFEYQVIANQKGTFSNGVTSAQCMYAPEFSSHSEGIQVTIQ